MDRRERLVTLRDLLTDSLPDADARSLASISRELRLVLLELDALPSAERVTAPDELADDRKKRRAGAGVSERPASSDKRRR